MSYLGPNRFPFMQKPADLDTKNELNARVPKHFDFALVCHVDQLEAEGFGRSDILRYVEWKRGQISITEPDEIVRMNRLGLLIIINE